MVAIEKLIPLLYRRMPFLAVSESSKQDLVERGVPAERIDLLYNGITFPQIEIRPVAQRPCRIAYLGRLEPYKRIGLLLRAVARLAKRLPQLELVVVGRGSEREPLERLAAEQPGLQLQGAVELLKESRFEQRYLAMALNLLIPV